MMVREYDYRAEEGRLMVKPTGRMKSDWYGLCLLLAAMGVVAVLSAIGPLGYFAMCVAAVGGLLFFILLRCSVDIRRSMLSA